MKFTASRLSEGNKVFPAQIHIEQTGVTVKIPGLFRGDTKFFAYNLIASVDVKAPLVGYSTVTFYAGGTQISAHGFTSGEVKQIKQAIEKGKSNSSSNSNDGSGIGTGSNQNSEGNGVGFFGLLKSNQDNLNQSVEAIRQREEEAKKLVEGKVADIAQMTFGTTTEEISNQLSQLITFANAKPDKKVKSAILEKMEFGIMKLKGLRADAEASFFEQKLEPLKKKSWF